MPPLIPRAPHIIACFRPPLAGPEIVALTAIPGIRAQSGGRVLRVPHHAVRLAAVVFQQLSLTPASLAWAAPPGAASVDWSEVEACLRATGEVRDFVLDGFLTTYQKTAMCFGLHREGVHLWHPTGSGKTLTGTLLALCHPGLILVVTRAASRLQFGREIERYTTLRPYVIRPAGALKKGAQTLDQYLATVSGRGILVVGWEALMSNLPVLEGMSFGSIIYDESHRGKSTKRWDRVPLPELVAGEGVNLGVVIREQAAEARARGGFITEDDDGLRSMMVPTLNTAAVASRLARQTRYRILTTATPIKDRVRDLWGQLDLGEPDSWGSATTWMNRYCDRREGIYGGYDTTGSSNLDELTGRLNDIVHRVDYAESTRGLPPKRRQSVYIAPEDQGRPTAGFPAELKQAFKRGPSALIEVKLQQSASKKRPAVMLLVGDHVSSQHKVTIFTGRKLDVDTLGAAIRKKFPKLAVWASHGGDTPTERQQIVDDYMAHPGPCVLVGTGDAFGESINLHDTDAALFVMLPWTPGQVRQWEGRFVRLGLKRPVVIYYVVAEGTVDEHVADKLISKLPGVEKVVQDTELADARHAIGGTEDEEALIDSILAKLED
jgi:hypothetical protein